MRRMRALTRLEIVPGATHLFEEPGAIERVCQLTLEWCAHYMKGSTV
jgi:putative phosphoribosyl transferase